MNAFSHRTWVPFYLVSFGTLSVAAFRTMDGLMFLVSLVLVAGALGIIFMAIQAEVTRNLEKEELMGVLSQKVLSAGETRDTGAK